jgi:hypothetical protein
MEKLFNRATVLTGLATAMVSGSLLVPGLSFSAQAQTSTAEETSPPTETTESAPGSESQTSTEETSPPAETTESAPATEADAAATGLDAYTYADLFTIGLPAGWQATEQADSPQVVLTNDGDAVPPAETARIEITWYDQPPEVVVARLLNDLKENGYRVSRYEPEGIDNTTALNIWISDLPNDLPNAFMSYIGYADTTAAVVSYYTAPNPSLESLLVEVHESFERMD